jgi:two-component system nitrogen regulation response regulator GlnG/two-component system response regulator HydG
MDLLVRRHYSQHVRELESFLWRAMTGSRGRHLALTGALREALEAPHQLEARQREELTPEVIQACLDRHGGSRTKAYRELGLRNRHVLYRLIKRHGLRADDAERESAPPPQEAPGLDRGGGEAEN